MGRKRKDEGGEEKDPQIEAQQQADREAAEQESRKGPQEPEGGPSGESEPGGGPSSPSPQGEARGGPEGDEGEAPDEDFGAEAEAMEGRVDPARPPGLERPEPEGKPEADPVGDDQVPAGVLESMTVEERRQVADFFRQLRQGRRGGPQGGQDQPPVMSADEIRQAQERESEAIRSGATEVAEHRGMTGGETDPASIPILRQQAGDPRKAREDYRPVEGEQPVAPEDRPLNEGDVRGTLDVLRARGDTAYEHPSYSAEARGRVMRTPRGDGPQRFYRVVGDFQLGAVAGPGRGGPDRAYTVKELGITESQVPRLLMKGVIVEEPQG
jgi:hypothetical protein